MHVIRVAEDRLGTRPIGQLCEASKVKKLIWCPKDTKRTLADTADYHVAMTMAMAFVNEPADLRKFLNKLEKPPGEYYVLIWNVNRGNSDAVFEFDHE